MERKWSRGGRRKSVAVEKRESACEKVRENVNVHAREREGGEAENVEREKNTTARIIERKVEGESVSRRCSKTDNCGGVSDLP